MSGRGRRAPVQGEFVRGGKCLDTCYTSFILNPWKILYIKSEHVAVPMNQLDLVLCDRPVRGPTVLPNRDLRYLAVSTQFQNAFVLRTITE